MPEIKEGGLYTDECIHDWSIINKYVSILMHSFETNVFIVNDPNN